MSWLSKKGDEKKVVPRVADFPLAAYVEREEPKAHNGVRIEGKLRGDVWAGFNDLDDLEAQVARECGGGRYAAKVYEEANKKNYLGMHRFTISGEPLINGKPIEPPPDSKKAKRDDEEDPVEVIKREAEIEKAKTVRDKAAAERKRLRRDEGLEDDAEVEEEDEPEEDEQKPEMTLLKDRVEGLTSKLVDSERKRDEDRRDERYNKMLEEASAAREKNAELFQMVIAALSGAGSKRDEGSGQAFAAQMEAIKAMVAASQESTRAILSAQEANRRETSETVARLTEAMTARQDNLLQMFLTSMRESGEFRVAATKEIADAKAANAESVLGLLKETWSTAMQFGMGKNPEDADRPTTALDLVDKITDRVGDVLTGWMALKGKATSEEIQAKVREVAEAAAQEATRPSLPAPSVSGGEDEAMPSVEQAVAAEVERQAAASSPPSPSPQPSAAAPSVPRKPRAPAPAPGPRVVAEAVNPRAKQGMDIVLAEFIRAVDEGKKLDNWTNTMLTKLPSYVVLELQEAQKRTPAEFIAVLRKYGSPKLVDRAILKLTEYSARERARTAPQAAPNTTGSTSPRPAEPAENPASAEPAAALATAEDEQPRPKRSRRRRQEPEPEPKPEPEIESEAADDAPSDPDESGPAEEDE